MAKSDGNVLEQGEYVPISNREYLAFAPAPESTLSPHSISDIAKKRRQLIADEKIKIKAENFQNGTTSCAACRTKRPCPVRLYGRSLGGRFGKNIQQALDKRFKNWSRNVLFPFIPMSP